MEMRVGEHTLMALARRYPLHLHHELDILVRRQHGDQVVGLEHETDVA